MASANNNKKRKHACKSAVCRQAGVERRATVLKNNKYVSWINKQTNERIQIYDGEINRPICVYLCRQNKSTDSINFSIKFSKPDMKKEAMRCSSAAFSLCIRYHKKWWLKLYFRSIVFIHLVAVDQQHTSCTN